MARKRMIDPSFWRDEKVAQCSYMERLLFIGLWNFAEDHGVGRANPLLIKADVFPYETLREADMQKSLEKLSSLGLILLYENDNQQYYFINNFAKHQTINRPSATTLPLPSDEHSRSAHGVLTPNIREVNIREVNILSGANAPDRKSEIDLITNTKEGYPIYKEQIDEWAELYPAVDIMQELRNMKGWLINNPKRRKTAGGILRFINSWLKNEQDRGRPPEERSIKQLD